MQLKRSFHLSKWCVIEIYIDLSKCGTPDPSIWNRTDKIHFHQGRLTLTLQMSRTGLINYSLSRTKYFFPITWLCKEKCSITNTYDRPKITVICSCVPSLNSLSNRLHPSQLLFLWCFLWTFSGQIEGLALECIVGEREHFPKGSGRGRCWPLFTWERISSFESPW